MTISYDGSARLVRKSVLKLCNHTYDRLKPSGAICLFEMVKVADGPMAANVQGMTEKTVSARANLAERNILLRAGRVKEGRQRQARSLRWQKKLMSNFYH